MADMELQAGEEVLLEIDRHFEGDAELYVLRVGRFQDPGTGKWRRARLEKRRFQREGDRWVRGKPLTLIAPDIRQVAEKRDDILRAMGDIA